MRFHRLFCQTSTSRTHLSFSTNENARLVLFDSCFSTQQLLNLNVSPRAVAKQVVDMSEDMLICTPPELQEMASSAIANLLPNKSSVIYEKAYQNFLQWAQKHHVENYSENVFVAYFSEKSKICKSSTLWSNYSMLKSTFIIKHKIDISKYLRLITFIKHKNAGYQPKKSNIFTREEITKFLTEAPDDCYLMWKVIFLVLLSMTCN